MEVTSVFNEFNEVNKNHRSFDGYEIYEYVVEYIKNDNTRDHIIYTVKARSIEEAREKAGAMWMRDRHKYI